MHCAQGPHVCPQVVHPGRVRVPPESAGRLPTVRKPAFAAAAAGSKAAEPLPACGKLRCWAFSANRESVVGNPGRCRRYKRCTLTTSGCPQGLDVGTGRATTALQWFVKGWYRICADPDSTVKPGLTLAMADAYREPVRTSCRRIVRALTIVPQWGEQWGERADLPVKPDSLRPWQPHRWLPDDSGANREQAYLSAEQSSSRQDARLPTAHADPCRSCDPVGPPHQGPQAHRRLTSCSHVRTG